MLHAGRSLDETIWHRTSRKHPGASKNRPVFLDRAAMERKRHSLRETVSLVSHLHQHLTRRCLNGKMDLYNMWYTISTERAAT